MGSLKKTVSYFKRNGLRKTFYMCLQRLREQYRERDYDRLRLLEIVSEEEYRAQKEYSFSKDIFMSLLVPAYETRKEYLRQLIDSVLAQSYGSFELIIADAGKSSGVRETVEEYSDSRIIYKKLAENGGIAANTNSALELARGDVILLLDHDDLLERDALFHIAKAFEEGALFVYTDEDKLSEGRRGSHYFSPNRKPDFDLELLYSNNYICHLTAMDAALLKAAGGFRPEYDGAQDYDLFLRCIEKMAEKDFYIPQGRIVHVPRVLYHWRVHELSTADNPESKLYAYEAGRRALEDMLKRRGIKGRAEHSEHLGFYRIDYEPEEEAVSVNIPEGYVASEENFKRKAAGYFSRPEIRSISFRLLDKDGRVLEGPFKGMADWDSGFMHRAAFGCCIDRECCAFVKRADGGGSLDIYTPEITFKKK